MKKLRLFSLVAFLLVAGLVCNSCYGPFRLTVKLHNWNGSVGGKWVNEAVFLGLNIIPVYGVCGFLDAVIFNSIEFWGGSNPISMNEGDEEIQMVKNGDEEYLIKATKNKFRLEKVKGTKAGETAELILVPEEHSCYLKYLDNYTKIVEYLPSETGTDQVNLYLPDGSVVCLNAGERDMNAIQLALRSGTHYMASQD